MSVKTIINPAYNHLTSFIVNLPDSFEKEGHIIYNGRNEIRVIEKEGLKINVKRFGIPFFINRFVYAWLRVPKAQRAYEYALKLRSKGISTPEPIAYICTKKYGVLGMCYFVSIQVPHSRNFYEFGTPPIDGREDVIKDFALFTATLHQSEVYHKDYSPGNILFDFVDGKTEFCIVDINRMQFGPVDIKKGCANFARLWGQKPFFKLLAREYAQKRHADVQQCSEWVLKYRYKFWKRFSRKHQPKFELDI
ncbi:lipopolysaccharide kinase InaA family protein [Porphyromonadaceae bacterium OttesenSCG-928-L07]|nr:lipopolysaccharide kinase InaA family protein [Porphyromonadaceae bacterium OttesenSCG-928-L07]MDL2251264.1 lipopolysaccharide kinase InaA family protein [Odoribacter sp. OttesenSCG-928-J03]